MIIENKIDLYAYFNLPRPYPEAKGYLNAYIISRSDEYTKNRVRPAMVIFPGGAYWFRSDRENEPIALAYLSKGFNAFTVEYSVVCESEKAKHPVMLIEAAMAVAYVRENADKYNVISDKIAVIGFSAGGHLAGTITTMFNSQEVLSALKDKASLCKPDASVLCYPVITFTNATHGGTRTNLTGIANKAEYSKEELAIFDSLSVEKRVTDNTPPCFIWATYEDGSVPVINSILMAQALTLNKVPFDLHVFRKGVHGLSLCNIETSTNSCTQAHIEPIAEEWFELSIKFLRQLDFICKN